MSLLGIDIGTTGCKALAVSLDGEILAQHYQEYDILAPQPNYAELDAQDVWRKTKTVIAHVAAATAHDPIETLAVSSLGEALVPVTHDRKILDRSILFLDPRGQEFLPQLQADLNDKELCQITGNTSGNQYSLTKLMWIRRRQPDLYKRTDHFLLFSSFIAFMLGAEPTVDYSLANRTLCFDLDQHDWSAKILDLAQIDATKLPRVVKSTTPIGTVSQHLADELGLPSNISIVAGAHDQCANAIGAGVIEPGHAMFGMGTFLCAVPIFDQRPEPDAMMAAGLSTEHHAADKRFVSFIYNQGGCLVKWFRDTFAAAEHQLAQQQSTDIYDQLFAEMSPDPTDVIVLPYFTATAPPKSIPGANGLIANLNLETPRADILKAILQGATFYLTASLQLLPQLGQNITEYRAVGGGSNSPQWLQLNADILNCTFTRPKISEAGALGAAIIAAKGHNIFPSLNDGIQQLVTIEHTVHPDPKRHQQFQQRLQDYRHLAQLTEDNLHHDHNQA